MTGVNISQGAPIYQTGNASLYLCDDSELFTLVFFGHEVVFRFCELVAFRSKLREINLVELFDTYSPGIELIHLPHCDRFFALSIAELLELRDLFSGSFVMMELNSIIHQKIIRNAL